MKHSHENLKCGLSNRSPKSQPNPIEIRPHPNPRKKFEHFWPVGQTRTRRGWTSEGDADTSEWSDGVHVVRVCVVCESTRALRPKGRDGARVAARGRWATMTLSFGTGRMSPTSDASPGLAGSRLDRLEATPLLRRRLGEPYVGPSRVCVSFQLQRTSAPLSSLTKIFLGSRSGLLDSGFLVGRVW